jgi:hypothetical protein
MPTGQIIATPARNTFMGNRGVLHNPQGEIERAFQGKRWITCLLEFKGRRRAVMTPGCYTELFFLDEATVHEDYRMKPSLPPRTNFLRRQSLVSDRGQATPVQSEKHAGWR